MYQMTLDMSDKAYTHLKYMIENIPDIEIKKETHKPNDNDFVIDVDNCLKTLKQIKKGDTKDFKEVSPKELFNELGI